MVQNLINDKLKCPRCVKGNLIESDDNSEVCCSKCGYVVSEKAEESSYPKTLENAHTGSPASLAVHDQGLSTRIGSVYKDASGNNLSNNMKQIMKRLQIWDNRSKINPVERNLMNAFSELGRIADKLTLSYATVEKAAYIYRKAIESKLVRGRSINAVITASVYAACRMTDTPRNLKDLERVSNIKRKDIARCYRLIHKQFALEVPVMNPISCIARIASGVNVPINSKNGRVTEKIKRLASDIIQQAYNEDGVAGKDPMGLAAASIYLACVLQGSDITQRNIALAAGVTEVTIRNRYKTLKEMKLKGES